jgi:hypothetical protein
MTAEEPAVEAGIDPVESESIVAEDEPTASALTVGEETKLDDSHTAADPSEARDVTTENE